jgi:hypothetical protein
VDVPDYNKIDQKVQGSAAVQQAKDPSIGNVKVKPMGGLTRWLMGGDDVMAKHVALLPGQNTVYYNPQAMQKAQDAGGPSVDSLVAHELEHGKQRNERGYFGYLKDALIREPMSEYGGGPLEGGAMDAENEIWKSFQRRDRQLPAEQKAADSESVTALQRRNGG